MLHRMALVRTDLSEEFSASFIRVTRIGELGTTLAVTSTVWNCFPLEISHILSIDTEYKEQKLRSWFVLQLCDVTKALQRRRLRS
jgi:hypothetical protein